MHGHTYIIFNKFDRKDSSSIRSVQKFFSVTMSRKLSYIKANFCGISKSITRLETVGIQLCDAINIVKQLYINYQLLCPDYYLFIKY